MGAEERRQRECATRDLLAKLLAPRESSEGTFSASGLDDWAHNRAPLQVKTALGSVRGASVTTIQVIAIFVAGQICLKS